MISVVISHKDRINQLVRCVDFLINQETKYNYEVIIVDGGSNEQNLNKLGLLEKNRLIKVYYFKDKYFNVSKYRNYGAMKSSGSIVTFLDADMIVPPDFIEIICNNYLTRNNLVLIHTAYGFRINSDDELAYMFDNISNENMKDIIKIMEFSDYRDSALEFYGLNFENCPAPWVYGWSGIISISKKLFLTSGMFDEEFEGWGSEDTDLAYRLWLKRGQFIHEKEAFGIHVAHESNNTVKENQNYINRRFLYSKYKTIETELYAFLTGVSINNYLIFCQKMHLGLFNPIYTSKQIEDINNLIMNKKTLCVGLDSFNEILRLNFTHYLTLNKNVEDLLEKKNKKVNSLRSFGLITDFDDGYFDVCVIFDSYNYVPKELYVIVIKEMERISKKVFQIKTEKFSPAMYNKIAKFEEKQISKLDVLDF